MLQAGQQPPFVRQPVVTDSELADRFPPELDHHLALEIGMERPEYLRLPSDAEPRHDDISTDPGIDSRTSGILGTVGLHWISGLFC
jgi:hypothetical protein